MKKLLLLSTIVLGLALGFTIFTDSTYERQYFGRNLKNKVAECGACGAAEYTAMIRNDFETGELDFNLVNEQKEYAKFFNQLKSGGGTDIIWEQVGPDNQGGRTRSFLIDKDDPNRMYVGGVAGGIWYSNNGGQSWFPVDDFMDNIIISSMAQAANGDIYVGTGEDFAPGSGCENGSTGFEGHGLFKSTDGGQSFQQVESTWGSTVIQQTWTFVQAVAADPVDPNRIYASTKRGLQATDDGGETWYIPVKTTSGANNLAASQDVVVGSDGSVICAVGNKLYVSPNGNEGTFVLKSGSQEGMVSNAANRMKLAIALSDPNYMYAGAATGSGQLQAIYQSTDHGETWNVVGQGNSEFFQPYGDQGTYDNALGVSATDPERILIGGLNLWKWATGETWTAITQWNFNPLNPHYVHADQHSITYHPAQPNKVYVTSDGGVGYSPDGGQTWSELNRNYMTTQFYTIATAANGYVMGGTQDNGTLLVTGTGNTVRSGIEVRGGDGAGCAFSNIEPGAFFASTQNGDIQRTPNEGNSFDYFYDESIATTTDGNLQFNSGIQAGFIHPLAYWEKFDGNGDPADTCFATAFSGSNGGVFITREALMFDRIPEWFRVSGPISGLANVLKFSDDGDVLFIGTSNGDVYRITNLLMARDSVTGNYNSSGALVESELIGDFNQCVTGIDVHPTNSNRVVVTLGNYGGTSFIRYSTNALDSAQNVNFASKQGVGSNALPRFPFYSCVIDMHNPNRVLVGTEGGIYVTENITSSNPTWTAAFGPGIGLANVPVYDMVQQRLPWHVASNRGVIYAGTHGRGMFKTSSLVSVEENEEVVKVANMDLYPNPVAGDRLNINFNLLSSDDVTLSIYDLNGSLIDQVNLGAKPVGIHKTSINTNELANGTYILSLQAGDQVKSSKFVVLR